MKRLAEIIGGIVWGILYLIAIPIVFIGILFLLVLFRYED